MIKQPIELEAIQAAIDITLDTLKYCLKSTRLRKYGYENELEADISSGFRKHGADGHAFDPIVASGPRACTMHYFANNHAVAADELMLLDVGAQVEHYASDIARTVAIGPPSRRQQTVYEAVLEAEEYAFSLLRPGASLTEYEHQVEMFIGEKLRELNLLKTIDSKGVRQYFPHRTSHYLGLTAHDAGDYERPLEPGVVLAVETGIYIPEEGIGVRIEDNVVITENGYQNLSQKLPRILA
jgi:Xaa-Pro aminopeptidase